MPLRRLRILACTKPRRLPGVRCVMLKTEYSSLLNLITIPGRSCVAVSILVLKLQIVRVWKYQLYQWVYQCVQLAT